jgi:hypothetical protein
MSKEHSIVTKLFAGHDAGLFSLPHELLERRAAEQRVNDTIRALDGEMRKINPAAVRLRLVEEVIETAGKSEIPSGFGKAFIAEQEKLRVLSADHSVLSDARDNLRDGGVSVPWVAMRLSEEILAKHLRPAMEETLGAVRAGAAIAASVPWGDPRALVRASDEVRDYHEVVAVAADRYGAIRDAQWRVKALAGKPSDDAYDTAGSWRASAAEHPRSLPCLYGSTGRGDPRPAGRFGRPGGSNRKEETWRHSKSEADTGRGRLF